MRWNPTFAVCLLLLMSFCCALPAVANVHKRVSSSLVVNAPKDDVWKILTTMGHFDDKMHSQNGNEAIVEQKFKSLPMLSAITVVMKATVTPTERIDFEMTKADHLKDFEGTWTVASIDEKKTKVGLSMFVDPGLPVPRFLVNKFIEGKVKSRLRKVKQLAEKQP